MKLTPALLLFGAIASLAHAQVSVVNDSAWSSPVANAYVGGSSGLNYYGSSGSTGNLSLTGDSTNLLTLNTIGGGRGLAVTFATQSLASVGDSITASIQFKMAGPVYTSTSNNFRIALHNNTGGTAISANNFANTNTNFVGYVGYMAAVSVDFADSTPVALFDKVSSGNALIGQATEGTQFTTLAQGGPNVSPADTPALAAGTNYTASLVITRIASGVNIAYSLTGGSVGSTFTFDTDDTSSAVTSFNTLLLHVNSGTWDTTQLQNVNVSLTAIPEPSTYAALTGLLALGFVAWRRRPTA